jgi:hypothetical protein
MLITHLLSFGFIIGITALADKEAFAWMRGHKQTLDPAQLRSFHRFVWLGLLALIISGTYLFLPRWDYLLAQPLFIIKLLLVGVLLVNGILIGRLQHLATSRSFASLRPMQKFQLLTSGAISLFCWAAAALIALYLFELL